jgi:hypothetical protein
MKVKILNEMNIKRIINPNKKHFLYHKKIMNKI